MTRTRLVEIVNETAAQVNEELLGRIAEIALQCEGAEGRVVVALVEPSVIEELNLRYRDAGGTTDVLSFPAASDDWPEPEPADAAVKDLGELVVAPEVVRRYAVEEGDTWDRQLAWTIIHGVLHLLGHDHETDEGEMREREQAILAAVHSLTGVEGSLVRPSLGAPAL